MKRRVRSASFCLLRLLQRAPRNVAIVLIGSFLLCGWLAARAQQLPSAAPSPQASTDPAPQCSHPANPHRRPRECNDHDFTADETLAKGWDDVRSAMRRIGLTPTASYQSALQTNVAGAPHEVWSYAGLVSLGLSADFSELLNIPGLSAYIGSSWGTGSNLSGSLNSVLPTSSLYAPSFYLGEMYLQERFRDGKLTVLAGRLSAGNSFASLPVFSNYITWGINPNPYSLGANDATFFGPPPGTQWGAQATYSVKPAVQLKAGIFNTNPNSANGATHGADFAFQEGNKGTLSIGEIDYLTRQGAHSKGKPGQITVGVLHSSNSFPVQNNPLVKSDGYNGVYLMGQQMVYRPGGPSTTRGARVWASWTFNSKDTISLIPNFWSAGASYQGLITSRPNDIISVALLRAEGSTYAPPFNTEGVLELNYQWFHSRYLAISPHAQYLWRNPNPVGRRSLVLGVQLALAL